MHFLGIYYLSPALTQYWRSRCGCTVARRTEMHIQVEWGTRGCGVVSPIRAGVERPPPRRWRNEYVGGGVVSSFGRACPTSRVAADVRDIDAREYIGPAHRATRGQRRAEPADRAERRAVAFLRISMNFSSCSGVRSDRISSTDFTLSTRDFEAEDRRLKLRISHVR